MSANDTNISPQLTKAQLAMLGRIASTEFGYKPIDSNFKSRSRTCNSLVEMGYASHYRHGGYELTEAGRKLLETINPTHFVEASFKGCVYRYYGWAHVKGARCIGEGDWRAVSGGREYRTYGHLVPAEVLAHVLAEVGRQAQ